MTNLNLPEYSFIRQTIIKKNANNNSKKLIQQNKLSIKRNLKLRSSFKNVNIAAQTIKKLKSINKNKLAIK